MNRLQGLDRSHRLRRSRFGRLIRVDRVGIARSHRSGRFLRLVGVGLGGLAFVGADGGVLVDEIVAKRGRAIVDIVAAVVARLLRIGCLVVSHAFTVGTTTPGRWRNRRVRADSTASRLPHMWLMNPVSWGSSPPLWRAHRKWSNRLPAAEWL